MIDLMQRRREMVQSQQSIDYITDGLVLHLDGINRGTTDASRWVDIIGGYEFYTADGTDAVWGNNHLVIPKPMYCDDIFTVGSARNYTLECVFAIDVKKNGRIYSNKGANGGIYSVIPGLGLYGNNWLLTNTTTKRTLGYATMAAGGTYCYSMNFQPVAVINGSIITSFGSADFYTANAQHASLGYNIQGKIYSIRIYNKMLTTDEMLSNQRVDNQRFNLGLTI